MNYYYDILVNLQEIPYEFYEWEKTDFIIAIKKTPIFKVSNETIIDFLTKECFISKEFVSSLEEKTITKNKKEKLNAFLITDSKNTLFLEFDLQGKIIYKSKLLVEDENNINEISKTIPLTNITYTTGKKIKQLKDTRQTTNEKKKIKIELDTILKEKNTLKCEYLYYEWFHEVNNDFLKCLNKMQKELDNTSPKKIHELVHLILLSYKEKL